MYREVGAARALAIWIAPGVLRPSHSVGMRPTVPSSDKVHHGYTPPQADGHGPACRRPTAVNGGRATTRCPRVGLVSRGGRHVNVVGAEARAASRRHDLDADEQRDNLALLADV